MLRSVVLLSFVLVLVSCYPQQLTPDDDTAACGGCGYSCDDKCNCGRCNTKPGCMSETQCLGPCNGGGNAKWCGNSTPPEPTCDGCGYNCDDKCNCGRCNTKPGCMSETQCLGTCNGGGNAKWCGPEPLPSPPAPKIPAVTWTTSGRQLHRDGKPVVLKGLGTTCTEYLLRGVGMHCWASYQWNSPADVIVEPNATELAAVLSYLKPISAIPGSQPAVRIPLCASSWLGVNTTASQSNMDKWPDLGAQYRKLITAIVTNYTANGIVAIVDLHWNDDDTEQQPMALKRRADGKPTGNALLFWDSIAKTFATNNWVFYELYNEPYINDVNVWMNGNDVYAGMLEMADAVRHHAGDNAVLVIAGAAGYAYDAPSLLQLEAAMKSRGDSTNVMFNFHPYMGPAQAGASDKCADGFESLLKTLYGPTSRTTGMAPSEQPSIITEFGQACCPVDGQCEQCPAAFNGTVHGYDHAVLTICQHYGVSWLPWAWRPENGGSGGGHECEDLNGGSEPSGLSLVHVPSGGDGGDFLGLWREFANPNV